MAGPAKQKIFISYARKDGTDLAQRLQADLGERAFDAWLDTERIGGGASWTREIETALDQSDVVLALLTPGSYVSEICRAEQLRSLRKGKCVIPLLVDRTADIPLHLEPRNYLDFTVVDAYSRQLAKLLEDIEAGKGVSVPARYRTTPAVYINAPPTVTNYIERPEAVRALRDTLFGADGHRAFALTALEGMGGIGKTVLAQALFKDEVVRQAFPDGLVWITVGRESRIDIAAKLREISKVLGGEKDEDISPETWYKSTLAGKAALIVIDDIWSKADLDPFLADSPRSRFLFTTRDASIAKFSGAREHRADLLDAGQARQLLALWAGRKVAELPSAADEVLRECGGLPLALSMIGALLCGTVDAEWADTAELLRKSDLATIEEQVPLGQRSFFSAIDVSVKALSPKMQQRYGQLAVLLEDMPAPPTILETLWNVDESEGRRTSRILANRSLVQGSEENNIRLHDLQLDYIRSQYPEKESLELIHGAIRLSSHVIAKDPRQFASQLAGRLLAHEGQAAIGIFTTGLKEGCPRPWLMARRPALDFPGGALIRTLAGHTSGVEAVWLSGDGRRAISASGDHTLKVWDVETGRELRTLVGHSNAVDDVDVSQDGRLAVSASYDKTLKVWDVESGHNVRTLEGHTHGVLGVGVSGDGRLAVSVSYEGTLKVWDVESGHELLTLEGNSTGFKDVAVSQDGRRAVSASATDDSTLKVWDVESGRELHILKGHAQMVNAVGMSEDGRRAVSASNDGTLKVWDVESGRELRTLKGHPIYVRGVGVTADGRCTVSASYDHSLKVWDVESGRELHRLIGHTDTVQGVGVSRDGKRIVSASHDGTLKVWDVEGRRELPSPVRHTSAVHGVGVSRDGRRVVSASGDGTLKVWDVESGRELHRLTGHTAAVQGVGMSSDGRYVVSASSDKTLKVWDAESGRELRTLTEYTHYYSGVAISGDGRHAISAPLYPSLTVWDVKNGKKLRTLEGHTQVVCGVGMSEDGSRAVSGSHDGTVRVWDVESGHLLHTLEGHKGKVLAVAVSGDGKWAISGSGDNTLKVWDLENGLEPRTLKGHTDYIGGVGVSRDGRHAVSASHDKTLKVWDLESALELATFTCEGAVLCCAFCGSTCVIAGDAGGRMYFLELVLNESAKRRSRDTKRN
jgi:WD40 repeat protein